MNFATMAVLIVFMCFVGTLLILQQVKNLKRTGTTDEGRQLRAQLSDLEERVRTLERIATDEKSRLKKTIETL